LTPKVSPNTFTSRPSTSLASTPSSPWRESCTSLPLGALPTTRSPRKSYSPTLPLPPGGVPISISGSGSGAYATPPRHSSAAARRPRSFLESFFSLPAQTVRDRDRIELPFGRGKTSPVAAADVARIVATVLANPRPHVGRLYELTGPRSQDMHGVARELSDALNREITYADIPHEDWARALEKAGVPEHLALHLLTMAELHRAGRYDRLADGVEQVTGRPATSVREFVSLHADQFGGRRPRAQRPPGRRSSAPRPVRR
jgi:hypothetical protein